MKKIQVLLLCLLTAIAVQAQTSAKAQTRVAEVRKLYAAAKEGMAYNDQEDYPAKSNMEITYNYMAPGAGPIKHYIKYYISSEENDVGEVLGYKTYFVSDSYNSGARKIYEEYLLDEYCTPISIGLPTADFFIFSRAISEMRKAPSKS